jgi:hypothetical protein
MESSAEYAHEEYEDSAVQDFLQILEEHRRNCERQGKYTEAEVARTRLEDLKMHEENRRKEAMRSRQIAERLGVEEAHMLEFQQLNAAWDKKMTEYDEHAAKLVVAMKVRGVVAADVASRRIASHRINCRHCC